MSEFNNLRFNVGDRVRVVKNPKDLERVPGETGVLAEDDGTDPIPFRVRFDDHPDEREGFWCYRVDIELDTPTVFRLEVPAEPAGVSRVRSVKNPDHVYERKEDGRWGTPNGGMRFTWEQLVRGLTQGVEPVPSDHDYRVSLDYLRRNPHVLDELCASGVTGMHAATVVRGLLEHEV